MYVRMYGYVNDSLTLYYVCEAACNKRNHLKMVLVSLEPLIVLWESASCSPFHTVYLKSEGFTHHSIRKGKPKREKKQTYQQEKGRPRAKEWAPDYGNWFGNFDIGPVHYKFVQFICVCMCCVLCSVHVQVYSFHIDITLPSVIMSLSTVSFASVLFILFSIHFYLMFSPKYSVAVQYIVVVIFLLGHYNPTLLIMGQ